MNNSSVLFRRGKPYHIILRAHNETQVSQNKQLNNNFNSIIPQKGALSTQSTCSINAIYGLPPISR